MRYAASLLSVLAVVSVIDADASLASAGTSTATTSNPDPTWWSKYQHLLATPADADPRATSSVVVGGNIDVSNECGPQSEVYITIDSANQGTVAGGSNEIFRLPMRGYFSSDGGASWGGVDLPLPPATGGPNNFRFGSDPSLAFDRRGNLYYSYIVVFFSNAGKVVGTEMAVAKSVDGGRTYPSVTFFSFSGGNDHFNDKPMITTDNNAKSPHRDTVYVAWDAASGGSTGGGILVGRSTDGGATFSISRADNPSGPGRSIAAVPFVGPGGDVNVAWNDYAANTIAFARSTDGGATFQPQTVISKKSAAFQVKLPAAFSRGALVYPACDADRSTGPNRGTLYCSWMDLTPAGTTNVFVSTSTDAGGTWSTPTTIADHVSIPADRFFQWLAVDPTNGDVNVSFYDTRNDTTGGRYGYDVYFTRSTDGGATWIPNVRVSTATSNDHDCSGTFPCAGINYSDQLGDYAGLASYGGVSRPIWVDTRNNLAPLAGCSTGLAMEEVFTATVK